MFCYTNVDVNNLSSSDKKHILNSIKNHNILVFEKQKMTQSQLAVFASIFGEIAWPLGSSIDNDMEIEKDKDPRVITLSNIDNDGQPSKTCWVYSAYKNQKARQTNSIFIWHSDKSYEINPARFTMLYGVDVPDDQGDTEIIDTNLCYNDLSEQQKAEFSKLFAVHDYAYMRQYLGESPLTNSERIKMPPVVHPLIRQYDDISRNSIYFGMYCSTILYRDSAESKKIIDSIYEICTREKYIYKHKWKKGDILVWNNLHTMHRARNNYNFINQKRILDRITIR
jgi:alpha-ketoglutarate-dependent taurine dioxygenase